MAPVVTCVIAGDKRTLCTTCLLGGLLRCPSIGTPLPLVEKEKLAKRYITVDDLLEIDRILRLAGRIP